MTPPRTARILLKPWDAFAFLPSRGAVAVNREGVLFLEGFMWTSKWCCGFAGCLAAISGVDDLPVATVLQIASPGWRWDGKQAWCPKHAVAH